MPWIGAGAIVLFVLILLVGVLALFYIPVSSADGFLKTPVSRPGSVEGIPSAPRGERSFIPSALPEFSRANTP